MTTPIQPGPGSPEGSPKQLRSVVNHAEGAEAPGITFTSDPIVADTFTVRFENAISLGRSFLHCPRTDQMNLIVRIPI